MDSLLGEDEIILLRWILSQENLFHAVQKSRETIISSGL